MYSRLLKAHARLRVLVQYDGSRTKHSQSRALVVYFERVELRTTLCGYIGFKRESREFGALQREGVGDGEDEYHVAQSEHVIVSLAVTLPI